MLAALTSLELWPRRSTKVRARPPAEIHFDLNNERREPPARFLHGRFVFLSSFRLGQIAAVPVAARRFRLAGDGPQEPPARDLLARFNVHPPSTKIIPAEQAL
jgi:hypothetical protein